MAAVADSESILLPDRQCFSILDWAAKQPRSGLVLRVFLASVGFEALQPEEALALRVRDVELTDDGSGWLQISDSIPAA
ncbi:MULTISPECIES: hypothetical protein [unclassified Streptomyces]|uniref:hypothetical protein n=1 Tax=unclassified Streptomyces TaxID=2593676 RepID=UPI000DBA0700|nr:MULTISPECIES: hypothetical protein [unclassified Streptomyces]MYT71811.1 hypothetical protein [Streptomyces sp. SID8367]RAJ72644.1 hypothetical protein K377_07426 [Streptomyces sp. PsTaAH-137]